MFSRAETMARLPKACPTVPVAVAWVAGCFVDHSEMSL